MKKYVLASLAAALILPAVSFGQWYAGVGAGNMSTTDYCSNTSSTAYNIYVGYLKSLESNKNISLGLEMGGAFMNANSLGIANLFISQDGWGTSTSKIQAIEFLPELKYTAADNSYFLVKAGVASVTDKVTVSPFNDPSINLLDVTEVHPAFSIGLGHNYTNHIAAEVDYTYIVGGNTDPSKATIDNDSYTVSGMGTASISYVSLGFSYLF